MVDLEFFFYTLRYEVNFQNGIECGGAYVKLLSKTPELNLVGVSPKARLHMEMLKGQQASRDLGVGWAKVDLDIYFSQGLFLALAQESLLVVLGGCV